MYNQDKLIQVASISGGRTSHYMINVLIERYGKDGVKFVYCDTGAEHPKTYEFIKQTAKVFDIEITCLKLDMPKEAGVGAQYKIVPVESLKQDFEAFRSLMEKYGRPYMPGGKFCTDQMKTQIYKKYCNDTFGKDNYVSWIGYRDEPKDSSRVWGHSLSGTLSKWFNVPQKEQGDFYKDCREALMSSYGECFDFITDSIDNAETESSYKKIQKIFDRVVKRYHTNYRFLFEISDFDKKDILDWWDYQDFNLEIPPHCGNCVFCIEKSLNQLMYLCKSQPEQANLWKIELDNTNIPHKESRKEAQDAVYRGNLSFDDILLMSEDYALEQLEEMVGMEKKLRPCASGECSVFGDDDD